MLFTNKNLVMKKVSLLRKYILTIDKKEQGFSLGMSTK